MNLLYEIAVSNINYCIMIVKYIIYMLATIILYLVNEWSV